ncbi:hypothetical protein N9H99_06250, partial [Planktomarina temperata]|nr:hypothetical protein [Planktomarina temperata]
MSWSEIRNNESVLTGYNFVTQETVDSVQYTYTDTFDLNFELVANKWEDDASNSNTFGETVVSSTDTSAWAALEAEFTWLSFSGLTSVRVQEGANSWLEDGLTVTESRKHLFDVSTWGHLGGVEAYDGVEVQYEAGWQRGAESLAIGGGTPQLTSSDGAAYDLFGAAYYTEESWMNWEGLPEYERTYYDGSGNKLGSSFTSQNQWTDNYTDPNNPETITNTNSNYNDPDGNWLGWSSVEMDSSSQVRNANQSSEKVVVASTDTTTWDALKTEFDWLTFDTWQTVRVQDETMSWLDGTTLVTESRKHLFDDTWNHLGGKEVTNSGAVVQYTSGWTRGEEKFQIATDTPQLDSGNTDHAGAISLFGNAHYYEESYTNWQGQQETETNYYSSTGVKLGSSFKFIDTWTDNSDPANPVTVTNTNINYNGPDWEWLGNEWYDTVGNGGQNFERVVQKFEVDGTTLTGGWIALFGDANDVSQNGDPDLTHITLASDLTSVRVQEGTNTWVDVTTSTSTTESRKHLFDVNNWDHLGGFESYDGGEREVQYEADWQRGAET